LQLLLDSLTDYAIYMLSPDGQVVSCNPAAERMEGYTLAEISGLSFARFFTAEDQRNKVPEGILERARAGGRVECEGWRIRKDGSRFWSLSSVHALRDDNGELIGFAKITRDITERRANQEALIESERRFRYLVESVVDYAIYMLDVNGTVTNWNRGAERIKGYRADDIVGRHFSRFYTPEDRRAGVPARMLATALKEGRCESEGWRVRKDGSRFWASVVIDAIHDDDGRHIGYAKITRDITRQRAAQQALEENERQFRLLVAGVVDYALFMLDPNGVVTNWNAGAEKIKGYSAEEAIGQHISTFYTAADREAGLPMQALQTAAREGRYEAETWRVRKDGTLFWANVVLDAIYDDDGVLLGFAKITRDITEQRNAQVELQRANERLLQAQKLEAVGQLTGGVAHDFNNLLMVVTGHSHLLRKEIPENPRVARAVDAILKACRRGQDLTRHLLAFARRQRLNPVAVLLGDRSEALRELLGASLGTLLKLKIEIPETIWPVEVDPGELELALLNMAVNARDAMPSGGTLTITAQNRALKRGDVPADIEGEYVVLSVRDTGFGIPPDILPKVFEPFFTTKDISKGTGLGLSQVHGFVQQSGGHVTVESRLGLGTLITIYLPRTNAVPSSEAEDAAADPAAHVETTVLVVEDNPEVGEVTASLLQQLGHEAHIVNNAETALKAVREGLRPGLVLTDIVMAGQMDGIALARHLRAEFPDLPIILATGYSQEAERIRGEFLILGKPYQLHELDRAVASEMSRRAQAEVNTGNLVALEPARMVREGRRTQGKS
jgi:PAS domain S-box-containing protein